VVAQLLVEPIARARAAWPDVAVDEDRFARAVAARMPEGTAPTAEAIAALHTDDLWLACACADGDPAALARFEAHCGPTIERAVGSAGAAATEREDLAQIVRQRLLAPPPDGGPPRIATYSAHGSLLSWVRVVATREAIRALPRAHREPAAADDDIARLVAPDDDPELGYLKRLYREELKQAFEAAVDTLEDRDRLLLRQHLLDRVGIDALAAQHAVHRATVARWIEAARATVVATTQRELLRRLRLSRSELASVLRLVQSDLDVSLPRVLGS